MIINSLNKVLIFRTRNGVPAVSQGLTSDHFRSLCRNLTYIQGQYVDKSIREYFYYIDHQGMLFLDDSRMKNFTSCFKEKKFLQFFFRRLKKNSTGRYLDSFPYLSICGTERNYIRCDDVPIVYTQIRDGKLICNHAGDSLTEAFQPDKLVMSVDNGRIYHPAPERTGGIGLIRSQLALEFSKHFIFDANSNSDEKPIQFRWNNINYDLDDQWFAKK